jgi:hypothetical protein
LAGLEQRLGSAVVFLSARTFTLRAPLGVENMEPQNTEAPRPENGSGRSDLLKIVSIVVVCILSAWGLMKLLDRFL